jgi:hypothetical protein
MLDFLKLCSVAREDEREQYMEMTGVPWNVDDVANDLFGRDGVKFCVLDDALEPVIVFGADLTIPGVWQTWMLTSDNAWKNHWKAITRHSRKVMKFMFDEVGARRIQTLALVSRTEACKWYVKGLRMTQESIAKGYGVTGQDFACFVRLREI